MLSNSSSRILSWPLALVLWVAAFAVGVVAADTSCPTTIVPNQQYEIVGDCTVAGQLGLIDSGAVSFYNGTLTIMGNLVLMNNAQLMVTNGYLVFPQTTYYQYAIYMEDDAVLRMSNSQLITNNGTVNSYTMTLTAYDNAMTVFISSVLYTTNSWLLANYYQSSVLLMSGNSQNVPTEIYPNDAATIRLQDKSMCATVWMNFNAGSEATLYVPSLESNGVLYDLTFGLTTGFDYFVNISNSYCRLGLNTYPASSMTIIGTGVNPQMQVPLVFGYYVQNYTSDITLSNLTVGDNITLEYTDQNRLVKLKNLYLNPFSWQVYVVGTGAVSKHVVRIVNSLINELGVFNGGNVELLSSVTQLAVLEADGANAVITVRDTQIWSQSITAAGGGVIYIYDSYIHGNYISVVNSGSSIYFDNSTFDLHNGNATITNCNSNSDGYPPNNNGVPLCNPYSTLHRCADVSISDDGGTINEIPVCLPYTSSPTKMPTSVPAPSVAPTNSNNVDNNGSQKGYWTSAKGKGTIAAIVLGVSAVLIAALYYILSHKKPSVGTVQDKGPVDVKDTTVNALFNSV
jgi:hypothetical protein